MPGNGWIKLYRKIQSSDMYKSLNSKQRDVMINCLLLANHEGNEWEWNGEIFECNPGQFITSLNSLKEVCSKDVSIQNIRTTINKLEKWEFLTNKSTKTGRLITIVNWEKYQGKDNETNKEVNKDLTKNQQSTNKELTTNKNVKNDKECKEVNNIVPSLEIEKIYNSLSDYWKRLFQDYIEIYKSKNSTGKITDNRHYNLLKEINQIFQEKQFSFNGNNYDLTEDIFEDGINTIIEKNINSLNYAKQIWISDIEKKKDNKPTFVKSNIKDEEVLEWYNEQI